MRHIFISLSAVLLLSLPACGGDDDSGGNPDALVLYDAGLADAARPDAKVGDGNDDFVEAKDLVEAGGQGYEAAIEKVRDRDYYKMTLAAGDWIAVAVDSSAAETNWNPAMKVFKQDTTTLVTTMNDGHPGFWTQDPDITFRATEAGTYYFVIGEVRDLLNAGTPLGGLTYTYTINGVVLTASSNGLNIPTENGDTAADATVLTQYSNATTGGKTSWVQADYKAGSDIDYFKFTVPALTGTDNPKPFLQVVAPTSANAAGYDNNGSTICPGKIRVATAAAPTTILAEVDACKFYTAATDYDNNWLYMPVEPGDYLISAERPATGGGANDFYSLSIATGKESQQEAETAGASTNNTAANAETVTLKASSGVSFGWFIAHQNPAASDVDWFKATAPASMNGVMLACWSLSHGSGVTGYKVEVFNDGGTTPFNTLTEPAAITPIYAEMTATANTTYHFKASATGQSGTVTGDFTRCLIFFYAD